MEHFDPFDADSYTRWLDNNIRRQGAYIKESTYSESTDTGRPRIVASIDQIPSRRRPEGTNYNFPLGDYWDVDQVGDAIQFTRNFTQDEAIEAPNSEDSILAFLAWLESLRQTGSAVGTDVLALASFESRTFDLDQGSGAATLTIEINSIGHSVGAVTEDVYDHVSVSFHRVTAETEDIDIEAIRTLILTETGSIPAGDLQETPEIGNTGCTCKSLRNYPAR